MYSNAPVFAQLMETIPHYRFQQYVARYQGNKWVQSFSCWEQYLAMAFAQLAARRSLRDIEDSLIAHRHRLYHMGFRSPVRRATLAKANENRDWRIYRDLAVYLIDVARPLYANEPLGVELDRTVYALDSTVVDLSLTLFPWAQFRATKSAVKIHTLLDLRGAIPAFVAVTPAFVHDVNILDCLTLEPGSFVVMDRAYLDFARLYALHLGAVFFITRAKGNFRFRRLYSQPRNPGSNVQCDQRIVLTSFYPRKGYPQHLRRIRYYDSETGHRLVFLTNNFRLPAQTICDLYRRRWQIELFFKWIKQHLRIKAFYGTSANAVQTQVWIAISVYTLVAILKKRLGLHQSLYTIMQILNLSLYESVPISQLFTNEVCNSGEFADTNQLSFLD
jgi:hypothetical protein